MNPPSHRGTKSPPRSVSLLSTIKIFLGIAPHCAVIFVWLVLCQPSFLVIFACSPHPSPPLEQANWVACCEKLPPLLQVPKQEGLTLSKSTCAAASPIGAGARPSQPSCLPTPLGDSSSAIGHGVALHSPLVWWNIAVLYCPALPPIQTFGMCLHPPQLD